MKPVIEGQDHTLWFVLITLIVSCVGIGITTIWNEVIHCFSNEIRIMLWVMFLSTYFASTVIRFLISHLEKKTRSKGNYIQ